MPQLIKAKTILNKTKRRDPWFLDEYTLNPYSGCSFNCLYCYIRGSKYGVHMEEKLSIKVNAVELLDKQLGSRARRGQYGFIVVSSATDPYLQFEQEHQLTRHLLEVILKYKFPVHIITKSNLVIRDFDLLRKIDKEAILPEDLQQSLGRGTLITFSFSTLDDSLGKIFEPGAPLPSSRLDTLQKTVSAGFKCGVSMMPLLPYITDTEESMDAMLSAFSKTGAHYVFPASITLFGNGPADSKMLVLRAVEKYFPLLLDKYKNFFDRYPQLPPTYINAVNKRAGLLCEKYGLKRSILTTP